MRVLIDTNVYLSYMLAPASARTITTVVTVCFTSDAIDVLVPHEQLHELATRAAAKRYFRRRTPRIAEDAHTFYLHCPNVAFRQRH